MIDELETIGTDLIRINLDVTIFALMELGNPDINELLTTLNSLLLGVLLIFYELELA